jgi:hypothetical protein
LVKLLILFGTGLCGQRINLSGSLFCCSKTNKPTNHSSVMV